MKNKTIILYILFFLSLISLLSVQIYDLDINEAKKEYNSAYKNWKKQNIKSYYMKIKYDAFSPISGIYELLIENNKVKKWIFQDEEKRLDKKEIITGLNMDKLFDIAKRIKYMKDSDDFIIVTVYDKDLFYIRSLTYMRNPNSKNKKIPNDKAFKYEILDFKKIY